MRIGAGKNALAAALHIVGVRIVGGMPNQTRGLNREHAASRREHLKGFAFEETIATHHDRPMRLRRRCGQPVDKREAHAALLFRIGVRRDCLATRGDSGLGPRLDLGSAATGSSGPAGGVGPIARNDPGSNRLIRCDRLIGGNGLVGCDCTTSGNGLR